MELLKILLVDDSVPFLRSVYDYLDTVPNINIVGTAQTGEDAVEQAQRLKPDVVFMDISLPGMNGFEATRRIKETAYPPHVVMLTLHNSIDYRCHATAAGADAFIAKDQLADEIAGVIGALAERKQMQVSSSGRRARRPRPV